MNLFVAILLESLAEEEEEEEAEEEEEDKDEKEGPPELISSEAPEEPAVEYEEGIHPARAFCRTVVHHKTADIVLLIAIGLSSSALALDTPTLDPNSDLAAVLTLSNYFFTALFTMEATMRILAYDP